MVGDAGGGVEGTDVTVPACCFHLVGRDASRDSGLAVERDRDTRVEDEDDAVDGGTDQRAVGNRGHVGKPLWSVSSFM